jgi:pyruvate carboxylase subunit B
MKYFVTVLGRTLEVTVDGGSALVDGQQLDVELHRIGASPELSMVIDGRANRMAAEINPGGIWRLTDKGSVHDVQVVDERTRHIRSLAGSGQGAAAGGSIKAPMPGLVVRILVGLGDQVEAGTPLVVLEAMKMENELRATGPGVVTALHMAVGQVVDKGKVLVEVDALD